MTDRGMGGAAALTSIRARCDFSTIFLRVRCCFFSIRTCIICTARSGGDCRSLVGPSDGFRFNWWFSRRSIADRAREREIERERRREEGEELHDVIDDTS